MADRTVVLNLSAELSRRFNRQRLTRMRRAFNIEGSNLFQETFQLEPSEQTDSRGYSNFITAYSEGSDIQLQLTIDGTTTTIPLTGFAVLPGQGSAVVRNNSVDQTAQVRLVYS